MDTTTQNTATPAQYSKLRLDFEAAALEFLGTTCFLLLGLGGIQTAASRDGSEVEKDLYFSTSMGLSLLISAWFFYRVTGGLFNPNISFALWIVGSIGAVRFVLFFIAQLAGGIAAAALLRALTPEPLAVKYDFSLPCLQSAQCLHYANNSVFLQSGINKAQGVFIEMFITSALVLAVLMLAVEKHLVTPFAPVSYIGHIGTSRTYLWFTDWNWSDPLCRSPVRLRTYCHLKDTFDHSTLGF